MRFLRSTEAVAGPAPPGQPTDVEFLIGLVATYQQRAAEAELRAERAEAALGAATLRLRELGDVGEQLHEAVALGLNQSGRAWRAEREADALGAVLSADLAGLPDVDEEDH